MIVPDLNVLRVVILYFSNCASCVHKMLPIIAQSDKRYVCPKAMNIIDNNVYIFTNVMHVPPLKIASSDLAPSSPGGSIKSISYSSAV